MKLYKKMIAPIIVSIIVVLYYAAYFALLISVLDGLWEVVFGILPLLLSVVMIKVCLERINEIKRGEQDDLSQY